MILDWTACCETLKGRTRSSRSGSRTQPNLGTVWAKSREPESLRVVQARWLSAMGEYCFCTIDACVCTDSLRLRAQRQHGQRTTNGVVRPHEQAHSSKARHTLLWLMHAWGGVLTMAVSATKKKGFWFPTAIRKQNNPSLPRRRNRLLFSGGHFWRKYQGSALHNNSSQNPNFQLKAWTLFLAYYKPEMFFTLARTPCNNLILVWANS